jgi:hypothetical protein
MHSRIPTEDAVLEVSSTLEISGRQSRKYDLMRRNSMSSQGCSTSTQLRDKMDELSDEKTHYVITGLQYAVKREKGTSPLVTSESSPLSV